MLGIGRTSPMSPLRQINKTCRRCTSFQNLPTQVQTQNRQHVIALDSFYVMIKTPVHSRTLSQSSGLHKSNSTRSLASLADIDALIFAQDEEERTLQRRKSLEKPPRHASVPMYAQILLQLWQRELQCHDVDLTSDFFHDLKGTEEQGVRLVGRMQALGFNLTVAQFFALPRCSIYSVLLIAL